MPTSDASRLLLRLACFVPLVAAPVLTNWICTKPVVQRRFARGLDGIADTLIAGKTIWTRDDLRMLKAAWITRMPAGKDILILGGSRALLISSDWFQHQSMFNAAVSGGDIDDMISIFQLCLETGKMPRVVVLEVNPSLVREGKIGDPRSLAPYFRHALARYRVYPLRRPSAELFSFDLFQWNVRRLQAPSRGFWRAPVLESSQVTPDGTSIYVSEKPDRTPDEVEAAVIWNIHHLDSGQLPWRTTSRPGGFDLQLFRRFLDDLQSRGIRVVVWLAPLHPVAYGFYAKLGGYDETWIRREMAARSITVVGSYSPAITRATKADFFDDVHPRAAAIHRLFQEAGVTESTLPGGAHLASPVTPAVVPPVPLPMGLRPAAETAGVTKVPHRAR